MHKYDAFFSIALHPDGCNAVFLLLGTSLWPPRAAVLFPEEVSFMEKKTTAVINHHYRLRALCEGAILIALAEILSFLPFYRFPWGGAIDLAMLPILVACVRWGFGPGMLAATAHAILQTLFEGGIAIGWQSILGDFLIAYTVLGTAGLFRGKFIPGAILACTLRFSVHYVVGATVWAEYMPETFFDMTMTTPWLYSALYNGAYMLPDLILVLIAGVLLLNTPARKFIKAQDIL